MKQIVTIFRAEGAQAKRLIALCRKTPRDQLTKLRDLWRKDIRRQSRLSGYSEYLDGWSMGDDYEKIAGPKAIRRKMSKGGLLAVLVTDDVLDHLHAQSRRKHQFTEQAEFARQLASLAEGCGACEPPVALAIFREAFGVSISTEELKEGSNQPL